MIKLDESQQGLSLQPRITLSSTLFSLHYGYPALVFFYYMASSSLAVCTLQTKSAGSLHIRRRLILLLLLLATLTYLAQLITLLVRSLVYNTIILSQDTVISLLSCILVYGVEFAGLADSDKPVWYPYVGSLSIALVAEPTMEVLTMLTRTSGPFTYIHFLDIAAVAARCLAFVAILAAYRGLPCATGPEKGSDAEQQTLIPKEDGQRRADPSSPRPDPNGYGSVADNYTDDTQSSDSPESDWERRDREAKEQMEKRLAEEGNWFAYTKSFMVRAVSFYASEVPVKLIHHLQDFLPLRMARQQQKSTAARILGGTVLTGHELHQSFDPETAGSHYGHAE